MSTAPLSSPQKRALAGIVGLALVVILSWGAWLAVLFLPFPGLLGPIVLFLFVLLVVSGNLAAAHVFTRINWRFQPIPSTDHMYVSRRTMWIGISAWVLMVGLSIGIGSYVYAALDETTGRTVKGLANFITLISFGALIAVSLMAFRFIEPVRRADRSR